MTEVQESVRELLRRHGIRLHDSVIAELATQAEVEALRRLVDAIRMMIDDPEILNMIDEVYPRRVVA